MKPMADSFSNILMDLYPVEDTSHETAKFAAALEQMPLDTVKELAKAFGKKAAIGTIYPSKDEPATSSSEGRIHDFLKQDKVDPLFGKLKQAADEREGVVGRRTLKGLGYGAGTGAALGAGGGYAATRVGLKKLLQEEGKTLSQMRPGLTKNKVYAVGAGLGALGGGLLGGALGAPIGALSGAVSRKSPSPEEKEKLKRMALAAQKKAEAEEGSGNVLRRRTLKGLGYGAAIGGGLGALPALLMGHPGLALGSGLAGAAQGGLLGTGIGALSGALSKERDVERALAIQKALEKAKTSEAARILDLATDIAASSPAEMAGPIKKVAGRMLMECWKTGVK